MGRRWQPARFKVELSMAHQPGYWECEVWAMSREIAILRAGVAAERAGILLTEDGVWITSVIKINTPILKGHDYIHGD